MTDMPRLIKESSSNKTKSKLWKDNQTTISFACTQPLIGTQRRFYLNSIYWPKNSMLQTTKINKKRSEIDSIAAKISKHIDEEEKNQLRMNRNKNRHLTSRNWPLQKNPSLSKTRISFKLNTENQEIVNRLTRQNFKKQSKLRDRHGYRNNMFEENPQMYYQSNQFRSSSNGFQNSNRIKLELPHNYYPGPGTYTIHRFLEKIQK